MGGFDVVLGNPPWERIKLQEKEWFAERSAEHGNAVVEIIPVLPGESSL
jgi:hypothetical protein